MERAELTSRVIPLISLSIGQSAAERAANRFRVYGNAVVTGGAGDLGFTAYRALFEHGLSGLVIFDLSDPNITAARVTALQADFPPAKISFRRVNITDADDVARGVKGVVSELGSVDVLLAFAGVASCAHAAEVSAHEWRRVFNINATGSFLYAQAVAKAQAALRRPANIVLMASISAHRVNFP